MAFLPNIFGNKPANQSPNPAMPGGTGVQPPQNQQQNQPQNNNGNGSGGSAGQQQTPANSQMSENPLDPFMKLMTPAKETQEQIQAREANKNKGLFGDSFTPDNISKAVSGIDFMQGVNQESIQKALSGDAQSFSEVINAAVRNAVSSSVQMSHGMVEKGVATGAERFTGDLDSRFRDYTLRNQNASNPALQHPVGKAMLSTVARQIAAANPNMPADQVHKNAENMFSEFAKMLAGGDPNQQQANSKKDPADLRDDYSADA
jgi:hypothetical protein